MRKTSFIGVALALTLLAGTAPAYAKDVPSSEKINDKIMPFLAGAQGAMNKKDYAGTLAQLDKAEPLAVSPYEKFLCGQFRTIAGQALKDDKNLQSGADEAADSGYNSPLLATFALVSGQAAYNAKNYAKAAQRFTQAQQAGSTEPNLTILLADSDFNSNKTADGLALLEKALAANEAARQPTPQDYYARAAQAALNAKMAPQTMLWMTRLVTAYPSTSNWHDLLAIYLSGHKLSQQALLDTYRLMRVTHSFKEASMLEEYAEITLDKVGLPGEAKAAIEDGLASGAIKSMTPNLTEIKNLATSKSVGDKASLPGAERQTIASPLGRVAKGTGDAFFSYADYAKALTYYKLAQKKGGADASALNMRLGMAQALSGDKASAKTSFAQVTGEEADVAGFWSLWVSQ